jgi:hypothetical protein
MRRLEADERLDFEPRLPGTDGACVVHWRHERTTHSVSSTRDAVPMHCVRITPAVRPGRVMLKRHAIIHRDAARPRGYKTPISMKCPFSSPFSSQIYKMYVKSPICMRYSQPDMRLGHATQQITRGMWTWTANQMRLGIDPTGTLVKLGSVDVH